jgi:RNA polymerase sigma-70 factor, ECF subfamily
MGPHGNDTLLAKAIAGVQQGDPNALHLLYVRYAEDVRSHVQGIVRDVHEAEDITHDVFAKLVSAMRKYKQTEAPFAAWILRVARNAALDHVRKHRLVPCGEVRPGRDQPEIADTDDRSRSLRTAFERLPSEQRQVVLLRHVAGLSPGEIAQRLEKTEGSVHCLHHRGRGALRTSLLELGAAPVTLAA